MMFSGYDMNPDGTASAFTADGFYKMGDVVQITWPEDAPAIQDASVPHSGVVRLPICRAFRLANLESIAMFRL